MKRKRLLWTVFLALAGFWFGWLGQGKPSDLVLLPILTIWGGCVGYGMGSIFDQRTPTKRLVVYWSLTTGLATSVLFPLIPLRFPPIQLGVAFVIGAFVGLFCGTVHLRLARRRSRNAVLEQMRKTSAEAP
jgi:hypothetical protein